MNLHIVICMKVKKNIGGRHREKPEVIEREYYDYLIYRKKEPVETRAKGSIIIISIIWGRDRVESEVIKGDVSLLLKCV